MKFMNQFANKAISDCPRKEQIKMLLILQNGL